MKKLLIALTLVALLLCSCGRTDYQKARQDLDASDASYTVTADNEMHLTVADGEEQTESQSVTFVRRGEQYAAIPSGEGNRYYYQKEVIYASSQEGKYRWSGDYAEFLSLFCYAPPLDIELKDAQKEDGNSVYTVTLSGAEYAEQLSALNPTFEELNTVEFGELTYTATVSKNRLIAYSYAFSFKATDGNGDKVEGDNTFRAKIDERAQGVDFPADQDEYISMDNLDDIGIEDDVFTEQVLYVIFESLYNPDGSKTENFDDYYQQFAEIYGEEVMQQIIEAADLFRDPSLDE